MAEGQGGVLRELIAVFGFGVDTKEIEHGENKLEHFFGNVKEIAEGLAGAFALHEIFEFAEANVHAMTTVEHLAAQIDISTDEVQAWQFAAQSAGFEADKFLLAMSKLQVAQAGAATGNAEAGKAFKAIGVQVKDASGHAKSADALFTDVAEAIKNTEDPAKRAAIATKLFGRSGRELLPFLEEGKDGIAELLSAYKELGGAYSEKAMKAGKDFEKQQAKLTVATKGLKSQILQALLPALTKVMEWTTTLVHGFVELAKHSNIVQAAMVVLGAAAAYFAIQLAIAGSPILIMVAAIALLVAVVDEIITTFQGGDTLIRRSVDAMFGEGYTAEHVELLRDAWKSVADNVKDAYQWLKKNREEIAGIVEILPPFLLARGVKAVGNFLDNEAVQAHQRRGELKPRPSDMFDFQAEGSAGLPAPQGGAGATVHVGGIVVNAAPGMSEGLLASEVSDRLQDEIEHGLGVLQQVPATGQ